MTAKHIPADVKAKAIELVEFIASSVSDEEDIRAIALALHEIEQAALAEGERAGLERAAKWHEAQAIASDSRITDARHRGYAKALRALPTPDAPAKGA